MSDVESSETGRDGLVHREVTAQIAEYLRGKGIADRKQVNFVAEVTGLSSIQARRRLGDGPTWLLTEVIRLAEYFGDSLTDVLRLPVTGAGGGAQTHQACEIQFADTWYAARARIGAGLDHPMPGQLVAVPGADRWKIVPYVATGESPAPVYEVGDLQLMPKPTENIHVAILDDDPSVASSVRDALRTGGFTALSFTSDEELVARLNDFDVFIIDFVLGPDGKTAHDVVKAVRERKPDALIMVLTGHARETQSTEIAALVRQFGVEVHEKPAQILILESIIQRRLGRR